MRGRAKASKSGRWRFSRTRLRRRLFDREKVASVKSALRLPLRELETAARFGAAIFLALDHARIAREESAALEHTAQFRLVAHQRLGEAGAVRHGLSKALMRYEPELRIRALERPWRTAPA